MDDSRLMNNIPLAYKRSLVQSLPFSKEQKLEMMKKTSTTGRMAKTLDAESNVQTIFAVDEPGGGNKIDDSEDDSSLYTE